MEVSQIPPGFVQKIHLRNFGSNNGAIRYLQTQQICTLQPFHHGRLHSLSPLNGDLKRHKMAATILVAAIFSLR